MAGQQVRVLLVDENPDDCARVQKILLEIGDLEATLTSKTTCQAALEQLNHESEDVILVSDCLRDGTSLEFVRKVQTRGYLMPIILLTREAGPDIGLAATSAGAVDYVEKEHLTAPLLSRVLRYAMQRAQMLVEMRELSIHDELTGLHNRKEFYRMLAEEAKRCLRYRHAMTLLMCDLDRFKAINDTCGPITGDEILRAVARALRKVLRAVDRTARYGADEFAVILPETSAEAARRVAERLRLEIPPVVETELRAAGIVLPGSLTLSVGLAELPGAADNAHALIESVNQALYAAKCRGGHSVVSAGQAKP